MKWGWQYAASQNQHFGINRNIGRYREAVWECTNLPSGNQELSAYWWVSREKLVSTEHPGILKTAELYFFLIKIYCHQIHLHFGNKKKNSSQESVNKISAWKFPAILKAHFAVIPYDSFVIDCKIQLPKMTNKSIMLLSLVVLHSTCTQGETTCKWQRVEEWHPQPSSYVVNWTLTENICMDLYGDCWFGDVNTKMNTSGNRPVPQICPLQIQLGDILVVSSEPSLPSPEINLMNVSEVSFINCLPNTTSED